MFICKIALRQKSKNKIQNMKGLSKILSVLVIGTLFSCDNGNGTAEVKVENKDGRYFLTVNGDEFFVKGAGCENGNIDALAESGANSFRTWGTNRGQEVLDKAHQRGLKVILGLRMKPERQGFDYSDTAAVKKQFEFVKLEIEKFKKHPALLAWAIGNELNLFYKNPEVWNAVNQVAEYIHENDPNHPATTTLAGISKDVIDQIEKRAPALDFISIQMYGDIVNLQERIKEAGWEGPYMVTEWGATGHWEVPLTSWGAAIEQTSTEKAKAFAERYKIAIESDSIKCLGSYVFLWGQKQERTPTWYGMFTEQGEETETVGAMYKIWKGVPQANLSPSISEISLNGKSRYDNITVKPGSELHVNISSADPENDPLEYTFEIMHESTDLKEGGDHEEKPEVTFNVKQPENVLTTSAPVEEGPYRLFFYVRDGKNHCATANIPFMVKK